MNKNYERIIKNKPISKNEFVLLIVLLFLILASFFIVLFMPKGNTVQIYVEGKLKYNYSIYENREIVIDDKNTITIKDGSVYMKNASCKDKLCVHHAPISKANNSIICLPNNVIIIIKGNDEVDAVT